MKKTLIIAACLVVALAVYNIGYYTAKGIARQECIKSVTENCEYICGVGADFYYPDEDTDQWKLDPDAYDGSVIALYKFRKGD